MPAGLAPRGLGGAAATGGRTQAVRDGAAEPVSARRTAEASQLQGEIGGPHTVEAPRGSSGLGGGGAGAFAVTGSAFADDADDAFPGAAFGASAQASSFGAEPGEDELDAGGEFTGLREAPPAALPGQQAAQAASAQKAGYGEISLGDEGGTAAPGGIELGEAYAEEVDRRAGQQVAAAPGEPTAAASEAGPGAVAAEIRRKKRFRRLRAMLAVGAALAMGGASLSFVPSVGPWGLHFFQDVLNRGKYQELQARSVDEARQAFHPDTYVSAKRGVEVVIQRSGEAARYRPLAAYGAFLGYALALRFGPEPELEARSRVALITLGESADLPDFTLARAAESAVGGEFARARQTLDGLAAAAPKDVDVAILRGEMELRARDVDKALAAWKVALGLEKSPRSAFGQARALWQAGRLAEAEVLARQVLDESPEHLGARILRAQLAWSTKNDDQLASKLLEDVVERAASASPDEVVDAQTLLGEIHLNRGRISHAEQAFGAALKVNPKAARALSGFGDTLYRAGRYMQALARFKAAVEADPDEVGAKVGVARTSVQLERLDEARAMLTKLRETHPKNMEVAFWYGRVQEALGEREAAEQAYRAAVALGGSNPETVHAYIALAMLQRRLGKLDEANQTLGDAQSRLPKSAEIHKALGKVAMSQGRYSQALDEFQEARKLAPDDTEVRFLVGTALSRERHFDQAMELFDAVGKVDPDFPGLALERGLVLQDTGHAEEALAQYQKALEKAPNDTDLMLKVGCGKATIAVGGQADELLRKVIAQRPKSAEAHYCLGRALQTKGNLSDALKNLKQAVLLDGNQAIYHLHVGWAANDAGQPREAKQALEKALELDQGLAEAYWQRGRMNLRQMRSKDAIEDLTKALELRPSLFEAHADLADAYYNLGREEDAIAQWEQALHANPDEPTWRYRYGRLLSLNMRTSEAAVQLEKALTQAQAAGQSPAWALEAHRMVATSLGNDQKAVPHWEAFLKDAPQDSPYRAEALKVLARLGHPWDGTR